MSRETKFGYGFLLVGTGVPYLIDKALGLTAAIVVSVACIVFGGAFLWAGHRDKDGEARPRRKIWEKLAFAAALSTLVVLISLGIFRIMPKTKTPPPLVQRTVVQVDTSYLIVKPDGTQAAATVVFRNKGPAVANNLRGFVEPLFVHDHDPDEEDIIFKLMAKERLKSTYPFTEGPALGIDETRKFDGITQVLTKKQVKEWQAGHIFLYVMGEVRYKDGQGELQTELCWLMTPPLAFKTDISIPWLPGFHAFCAAGQHNVIATPAQHGSGH